MSVVALYFIYFHSTVGYFVSFWSKMSITETGKLRYNISTDLVLQMQLDIAEVKLYLTLAIIRIRWKSSNELCMRDEKMQRNILN